MLYLFFFFLNKYLELYYECQFLLLLLFYSVIWQNERKIRKKEYKMSELNCKVKTEWNISLLKIMNNKKGEYDNQSDFGNGYYHACKTIYLISIWFRHIQADVTGIKKNGRRINKMSVLIKGKHHIYLILWSEVYIIVSICIYRHIRRIFLFCFAFSFHLNNCEFFLFLPICASIVNFYKMLQLNLFKALGTINENTGNRYYG